MEQDKLPVAVLQRYASEHRQEELTKAFATPETVAEAMELVGALMRRIPALALDKRVRHASRAAELGPLLNPTAWRDPSAYVGHNLNLEVFRRMLDLKHAVVAVDEYYKNQGVPELPDPDAPKIK